jgi:hypothetical protein
MSIKIKIKMKIKIKTSGRCSRRTGIAMFALGIRINVCHLFKKLADIPH